MSRLSFADSSEISTYKTLGNAQKMFGKSLNIFKTMAHSPVVVQGFLDLCTNLSQGKLSSDLIEKIALTIAHCNQCSYCMAAHSAGAHALNIPDHEIREALKGHSLDPKTQAALTFARAIADKRGHITNDNFDNIQKAGYSSEEIVEIFAQVMINLFTNYFNNIFQTPLDFPEVKL